MKPESRGRLACPDGRSLFPTDPSSDEKGGSFHGYQVPYQPALPGAPAERKRTKAEAVANGIGIMVSKIGDLDFPSFSAEDRAMLIETMTSMKDTLESAITRAVKNRKIAT